MARFKSIDYSNIVDDEFITEAKELLEVTKSKVSGSYLRYGKDKACDLDLKEELNIDKNEISNLLKNYFKKLKSRENEIILVRLTFDIIDESIKKLLDNLGNLNGLLQIENSNINQDQIDSTLPKKMINEITKLIVEYNKKKTIFEYVNLYMYLKLNLKPPFTIDEALKGKKKFNGKTIKLSDYKYNYMFIEVVYNDFKISNFVIFKEKPFNNTAIINVELDDVLIKSLTKNSKNKYQMSYYNLLKFFFHFLKKGYFNKIFEERDLIDQTIDTYNEIYDFREKVGTMHNNLCKIENMILIDKKNKKLHEDYKNLKQEFELKCKNYFLQVSKRYSKYLREYFKLI